MIDFNLVLVIRYFVVCLYVLNVEKRLYNVEEVVNFISFKIYNSFFD